MVKFTVLFSVLYGYAALRYHIGQDLEFDQFFFVLNKAISWTAFVLLTTSILKDEILAKLNLTRRSLGVTGYIFAVVHILLGLILLWENSYPKFVSNGTLNALGWTVILIGLIAFILFSIPFVHVLKKEKQSKQYKIAKWGVLVVLFHPFLIGWKGWFTPEAWPLYLPPITLLSVVYAISIWIIRLTYKR